MAGMAGLEPAISESKSGVLPLHYIPVSLQVTAVYFNELPLYQGQFINCVGWVKGLEPSTPGTTIRCSNQLSYTHRIQFTGPAGPRTFGTPKGIRTPDLLLRRQLLYPTELLAHIGEYWSG